MSDDENRNENIVSFDAAKERLAPVRKEKAAKDLRKQFQKAMGWNSWPKSRKGKGGNSKGPGPKKGKKR